MNSTIGQSSVIKKGIKSDVGVSAPLFLMNLMFNVGEAPYYACAELK